MSNYKVGDRVRAVLTVEGVVEDNYAGYKFLRYGDNGDDRLNHSDLRRAEVTVLPAVPDEPPVGSVVHWDGHHCKPNCDDCMLSWVAVRNIPLYADTPWSVCSWSEEVSWDYLVGRFGHDFTVLKRGGE